MGRESCGSVKKQFTANRDCATLLEIELDLLSCKKGSLTPVSKIKIYERLIKSNTKLRVDKKLQCSPARASPVPLLIVQ